MALKGVKVLEFAGLAPAPYCGMILADFGATVIRIDKVKGNTDLDCVGHGKKSIAIDVKKQDGIKLIKRLAKTSDVLIEPFRCGVMEKLGLGPDVLLKDNSKLIYARLTGFGQTGLYKNRAGHDINYVGLSGLLSLFGRANEKPMFPVNVAADFGGGGLMCALGIALALFERSVSGKGQVIDSNMVSGTAYLGSWLLRSQNLPIWGNDRGKNVLDSGAHFYEVYKTKDDKYMTVGAIEPQFYNELLEGLGIEDLEQFEFEKGKEVLEKKFLEKTQDEWCKIFDQKDACVFPLLTINEACENRHNKENNTFTKTPEGQIAPNPTPNLSRTFGISKATEKKPRIGQHTCEILKEFNYNEEEITRLSDNNVIYIDNKSKL